jgi:DNA-binding SARP family transcriptional activator
VQPPTTRLDLKLLGTFRAQRGENPLVLPTKKVQALLIYLALPLGRAHTRDKLTALLWGDTSEKQARASFRQALAMLKRALGRHAAPALVAEGDTVVLDPGAVEVDTVAFERLIAGGDPPALAQAAALYDGDLLEGFTPDEPPFDAWLLAERERLHELALEALARLVAHQTKANLLEPGIQTALRLLALDPLQEPVHRALMRLYARQGRRAAALRQYQACVGVLQRELGLAPEGETKQLYLEIVQQPALPGDAGDADVEPAGWSPQHHVREARLVGRQVESTRAVASLERAWDRGGRVLLVRGEAGIGKSRLVADLALEAARRGGRILYGACRESEHILPFRPWIDALRSGGLLADRRLRSSLDPDVFTQLGRLFPELGVAPAPGPSMSEEPTRLFEALVELLRAVAGRQPLVLVLEDLHWVDELSARLLAFAGRRLPAHPALLVATMRDEEPAEVELLHRVLEELQAEQLLDEVALQPLTPAETAALARALGASSRAQWPEDLADRVWALSEGNPFVIVESVRAMRDSADGAPSGGVPLPDRVRRPIAARLERLGEPARHLAGVAAIIGRDFSFAFLRRVAGLDEAATATGLEELVRRRVLDAVGERFDFNHDRIRHVAIERLLPARRVLIHRAVAEALEQDHAGGIDVGHDRLAHHYVQATMPAKAVEYLAAYADRTARVCAHEETIRVVEEALRLLDGLDPSRRDRWRVELLLRLATALATLGRFGELLDRLVPERVRVEQLGDTALSAPYWSRLALTYTVVEDQDRAEEAARRAVAEAEQAGDEAQLGRALYVLAASSFTTGAARRGVEHARRAVALLDRGGDGGWAGQARWILGLNHLLLGELHAALAAETSALRAARELGDLALEGFASTTLAWVLLEQGDTDGAIESCERILDHPAAPSHRFTARAVLGMAYADGGASGKGLELLEEAVGPLERFPTRGRLAALWLAEAYIAAGKPDAARHALARPLDPVAGGRSPWFSGRAWRLLGTIARCEGAWTEATRHLEGALARLAAVPAPLEIARTQVELARVAAAGGDCAGAAVLLGRARAAIEPLALPRQLERLRSIERALA